MFFIAFNIFSYSIQPQATTCIGYTKSYIKPSQSNLLSNYIQIVDTLWVKHANHQNDESLRTASPSNLGDIVNNSSNLSTQYAEFSTKWWVLLHFDSPSCGYNQRCNLHQETAVLLHLSFSSIFHPYLFTKSSLQSPLTLPSYITQQFFNFSSFCVQPSQQSTPKIFSLPQTFRQFRLCRKLGNIVRTDIV